MEKIDADHYKDLVLLLHNRAGVGFSASFSIPMTSFISDVIPFIFSVSIWLFIIVLKFSAEFSYFLTHHEPISYH